MNTLRIGALHLMFESQGIEAFKKAWPTVSVFSHGPVDRFLPLIGTMDLDDIPSMIRSFPGATKVIGWNLPDGQSNNFAAPAAAAEAFRVALMSVCLLGMDRHSAALQDFLNELARELHLPKPATLMHCNAYLSPVGNGLAQHFDGHEVIVLQLRGRKVWRVGPNRHVSFPTGNYVAGDPLPNLPEFEREPSPFGRKDLSGDCAQSVEMVPGSVLFLPRGYWHATEAIEESVSLTLGIFTPSWQDIVVWAVEELLGRQTEWRRPAAMAWSPEGQGGRQLQELLERLPVRLEVGDLQAVLERFAVLRQPARRLHLPYL